MIQKRNNSVCLDIEISLFAVSLSLSLSCCLFALPSRYLSLAVLSQQT